MTKTGLIALDIDGTLTADSYTVPDEVVAHLHSLFLKGWVIAIFTGRPYQYAEPIIKKFPFPLYVAVQNGAIILYENNIVKRHYLPKGSFELLDQVCAPFSTSFVIYGGLEYDNQCFYRPALFPSDELNYLKARALAFKEQYVPVESFAHLEDFEFPSFKCLGSREKMDRLAYEIRSASNWHVPVITDGFNAAHAVSQMTEYGVDKGSALLDCQRLAEVKGPLIAAGDDFNDLEMLQKADIKIVMATAPAGLLSLADIVAPPAAKMGIIKGLQEAIDA